MKRILILAALGILLGCQQKQPTMEAKTICVEMVTFKGKPEYTIAEVQKAMAQTNEHVKTFDGFIKRTISVNEEGMFLDVVYWESMEQAKTAAAQVQQMPQIMEQFKVNDFSTVTMQHFNAFSNLEVHD